MTESPDLPRIDQLAETLRRDGLVVLPPLLDPAALAGMRRSFESRLKNLRFNTVEGYEITESYRDVVENILLLDQGFVDIALHPVVLAVLARYMGDGFALAEAKGWLSRPTRHDFHGWHADAWYDQSRVEQVPREVKMGVYLTDVRSGAFQYMRRTHGREHPRIYRNEEVALLPQDLFAEVLGCAGTVFLFDTTGVHRQGVPMLDIRQALFYCYHDTKLPLQPEDVAYNRYHPLLLNASFLGGLTLEHQQVLGFGDATHCAPGLVRKTPMPAVQWAASACFRSALWLSSQMRRFRSRVRRMISS